MSGSGIEGSVLRDCLGFRPRSFLTWTPKNRQTNDPKPRNTAHKATILPTFWGLGKGPGYGNSRCAGYTSRLIWRYGFRFSGNEDMGVSQNYGCLFGVPIIRIMVFWGLYWGPPILGSCHINHVDRNAVSCSRNDRRKGCFSQSFRVPKQYG